jgi:hypothetical protein
MKSQRFRERYFCLTVSRFSQLKSGQSRDVAALFIALLAKGGCKSEFFEALPSKAVTVTLAAVVLSAMGCTAIAPEDPSNWWSATVVSIVDRSDAPSEVLVGACHQSKAKSVDARIEAVVTVRYRVSRSPFFKSFDVADIHSFAVGDRVRIQPDLCRIESQRISGIDGSRLDRDPFSNTAYATVEGSSVFGE